MSDIGWKMGGVASLILVLVLAGPGLAQGQRYLSQVDHLVYATPDLYLGITTIERILGVRATEGGPHPGLATRNALVALGPSTYLEIIGPDPDQKKPSGPRRFGIDELKEPRLIGWVAKGTNLEAFVARARQQGLSLGDVIAGGRKRPDGVALSWRYTNPEVVLEHRLIPYFIDWGASPHPSTTSTKGATLIALRAEHPDPERIRTMLKKLDLDLPIERGQRVELIATLDGAKGRIELRGAQ